MNLRGRLVAILFAKKIYFNIMLEVLKELLALLFVNLVGNDDRSCDGVPVVVHDLQVVLKIGFAVAESLDCLRILHNLSLEASLR